ncbi:hypothetical protein P170DRAFT_468983 [Aspergillus steynii IBT 23096]|uniref:Uncharacterized protein n=1 Tax=Aspergillus steynii IBT 23096 TaxID=1392250 RepID=A0A2I2FRV8_9EURO|nr:uncharacterized protein P170DRAFT_468983 [Aspergillus steynii IBT 23096]PLB43347.1 hypothetical protein P170DRAFT_468983 [Aspergillus steynii IBT 23096]
MPSDNRWFDRTWLGKTIQFTNPPSAWKITQKRRESEDRFTRDEYETSGFFSESSCIFLCEEITDTSHPQAQAQAQTQAIMKVRMQIPNTTAESDEEEYDQPPEAALRGRTALEIKALQYETQAEEGCVPGGFLDFIVMTRVEGVALSGRYLRGMEIDERRDLREAFKASYLYIVDWETWTRQSREWNDKEYWAWGLD